jgi:hypothetical protein
MMNESEPEFEILVFQSTQLYTMCKITGYNMARNRFLYWLKLHVSSSFGSYSSNHQIHASDDEKMVMIAGPFSDTMRTAILEALAAPQAPSESDLDD